MFPIVIQFTDTNKIKSIFNFEQLSKHLSQPIIILNKLSLNKDD